MFTNFNEYDKMMIDSIKRAQQIEHRKKTNI